MAEPCAPDVLLRREAAAGAEPSSNSCPGRCSAASTVRGMRPRSRWAVEGRCVDTLPPSPSHLDQPGTARPDTLVTSTLNKDGRSCYQSTRLPANPGNTMCRCTPSGWACAVRARVPAGSTPHLPVAVKVAVAACSSCSCCGGSTVSMPSAACCRGYCMGTCLYSLTAGDQRALPSRARDSGESCHRCFRGRHSSCCRPGVGSGAGCSHSPV